MEKMERRDKLMKLFYAVHRSQIIPIDAIEEIEALLTSEVEKERERLLGAVDVFIKPFLFDEKDDMAWKKQRKALSDIGGKDES